MPNIYCCPECGHAHQGPPTKLQCRDKIWNYYRCPFCATEYKVSRKAIVRFIEEKSE